MSQATQTLTRADAIAEAQHPRPAPHDWRWLTNWLGLVPFFLFVLLFQIFPAASIVTRSFQDNTTSAFTLDNIAALNNPVIGAAFSNTTQISIITSVVAGLIGFLVAMALTVGKLPSGVRSAVMSFCGVASNFAGVPLVFAFIATIGRTGIVTGWLNTMGVALYPDFKFYSFTGLCIVYLYFQIPLMILILVPALDALKKEWREASENLGATTLQYWRYVALPILTPAIIGTLALLFGNAFGTHATAYALVGGGAGQVLAVTILVGGQFSTDGLQNPGLGYSLSLAMIVVMAVTIMIYTYSRRVSARWLAK